VVGKIVSVAGEQPIAHATAALSHQPKAVVLDLVEVAPGGGLGAPAGKHGSMKPAGRSGHDSIPH
jgi:hypothetical protein